ncbi:N-acetylglucosamine-1-phosphotransferase subunit gamma [Frankliniella fusca]|uniref:N-acetylglucosamine-1-phosphotransferase subunit gamma n=1 Tax=Frankliniella fusca TaxID=407009 RepID=A0AAE1H8W2_9NEOP|nr:N-acetylglucosamine-1-phosphotransferase subunit gamma [Frankliniella fusca]KAK3929856.1 N-acetylglucosamine-1-phosphotransferase subunit gamma [Frankliniella fusca]
MQSHVIFQFLLFDLTITVLPKAMKVLPFVAVPLQRQWDKSKTFPAAMNRSLPLQRQYSLPILAMSGSRFLNFL